MAAQPSWAVGVPCNSYTRYHVVLPRLVAASNRTKAGHIQTLCLSLVSVNRYLPYVSKSSDVSCNASNVVTTGPWQVVAGTVVSPQCWRLADGVGHRVHTVTVLPPACCSVLQRVAQVLPCSTSI